MVQKRTLIITLVISILSLLYIILSYFGLIRMFKIKIFNSQNMKFNPNKPYVGKEKIIVDINATDPIQASHTINSIIDQTIAIDEIAVETYLPSFFKNKYPNLSFYLPSVSNVITREKDANTRILYVKEGVVYGEDFVEKMLIEFNKDGKGRISSDKNGVMTTPALIGNNFQIVTYNENW